MANYCTTDVKVTGPKEQVEKLYKIMHELENEGKPLCEGWGSTWYGNLITALGGEWEKVHCKGYFFNVVFDVEELTWSDEFAWREPYEVFEFLREKFPDIDIRFYAEEPGCCYFVTNIPDFAEYVSDFNCEWMFHDKLEHLLAYAKETYARDFTSFEELEEFSNDREECEVYKIDYVD